MKTNFYNRVKLAIDSLRRNEGLTMIELMISLAIIAIVATASVISYNQILKRVKVSTTKDKIKNLGVALEIAGTSGSYPTTEESLQRLVDENLIKSDALKDAWGKPFEYSSPGSEDREFEILSYGPDKQKDTEDDIRSWEPSK